MNNAEIRKTMRLVGIPAGFIGAFTGLFLYAGLIAPESPHRPEVPENWKYVQRQEKILQDIRKDFRAFSEVDISVFVEPETLEKKLSKINKEFFDLSLIPKNQKQITEYKEAMRIYYEEKKEYDDNFIESSLLSIFAGSLIGGSIGYLGGPAGFYWLKRRKYKNKISNQ